MAETSERTIVLLRLIDKCAVVLTTAMKWGAYSYIAYVASQALGQLAGEKTEATVSLTLQFLTKTGPGAVVIVSLGAGLLGVAYGLLERRLRYQKVEHLQGRVRELELEFDPNRSSSLLTVQGRTNPRDI